MSTDRIGIDFLSCTEISAVERAHVAADLGCRYFGISLDSDSAYQITQAQLRRDLVTVMADRGVSISMVEGIAIAPRRDIANLARELDAVCELGAAVINIYSFDPDYQRTLDQLGVFIEMVVSRGLEPVFEFVPCLPIKNLKGAVTLISDLANSRLRLVIDFMHILRSGCTVAELAAIDPDLIGYVQVSDVPRAAQVPDYGEEACHYRLPIGEGDVPLRELLAVLPQNLPLGIEAPMIEKANAGFDARERLASSVTFLRQLLADQEDGRQRGTLDLHKSQNEF